MLVFMKKTCIELINAYIEMFLAKMMQDVSNIVLVYVNAMLYVIATLKL